SRRRQGDLGDGFTSGRRVRQGAVGGAAVFVDAERTLVGRVGQRLDGDGDGGGRRLAVGVGDRVREAVGAGEARLGRVRVGAVSIDDGRAVGGLASERNLGD